MTISREYCGSAQGREKRGETKKGRPKIGEPYRIRRDLFIHYAEQFPEPGGPIIALREQFPVDIFRHLYESVVVVK